MVHEGRDERRRAFQPVSADCRGGLWSLPDGLRLPNQVEAVPLALGDPDHPARLRKDDLADPAGFHLRLSAWLLRQG